jgi:TonB family protein
MKNLKQISALILLGAMAAQTANAKVEQLKIEAVLKPQLSPVMLMEGVTSGTVVIAIDVSAEGELTDWLVLGTTHPSLVYTCVDAMKTWKFHPARRDGVAVPVQTELTINFYAEGVVISGNSMNVVDRYVRRITGERLEMTRRSASALDQVPTPVATVAPSYAREAEELGVKGVVKIHFYIDETGSVRMPSVEGEPHPYLAEQAITALKGWRFTPPMSGGKPVMVSAQQEFQFSR